VSNITLSLPSLLRLSLRKQIAQPDTTGEVSTSPSSTRQYAFPWPDELSGLGVRHVGPFIPCHSCGRGTWVRYGLRALCLGCAHLGGSVSRLPDSGRWYSSNE
jgi:hypothetical protein